MIGVDCYLRLKSVHIGHGSRCGLRDDAQAVEASDVASVSRGLLLRVTEVGRARDHRVFDQRATELRPRVFLHLAQDLGSDLLETKLLALTSKLHDDQKTFRAVARQTVVQTLVQPLHGRIVPVAANEALGVADGLGDVCVIVALHAPAHEGPSVVRVEVND